MAIVYSSIWINAVMAT